MSGHSKWSKIKHQKASADAKRGQAFSQVTQQITLAVREGGSGDPDQNPRLRLSLEKARKINMPKDNIKRAIDRGLGKGSGGDLSQITVEGYGPGGVAIMASATTDNQNRTKSQLRTIFDRSGGSTGEPGSVAYIFAGGDPSYTVPLAGPEADKISRLLSELEGHPDVDRVRHNALL